MPDGTFSATFIAVRPEGVISKASGGNGGGSTISVIAAVGGGGGVENNEGWPPVGGWSNWSALDKVAVAVPVAVLSPVICGNGLVIPIIGCWGWPWFG